MDLTQRENVFVQKRWMFARSWPIVGSIALATVLVFAGWLWFSNPLLINPWAVLSGLESGSIPDTTLALMAALLPVTMLTCLFVIIAGLILSFIAFSNERKHIAIIRSLTFDQVGPERKDMDK